MLTNIFRMALDKHAPIKEQENKRKLSTFDAKGSE